MAKVVQEGIQSPLEKMILNDYPFPIHWKHSHFFRNSNGAVSVDEELTKRGMPVYIFEAVLEEFGDIINAYRVVSKQLKRFHHT